jgi:hypothetical protein
VQQVHELIAPANRPSFCLFLSVKTDSSPRPEGRTGHRSQQQQKSKNADPLEQEPDAMSNAAIVASIIARQAVSKSILPS